MRRVRIFASTLCFLPLALGAIGQGLRADGKSASGEKSTTRQTTDGSPLENARREAKAGRSAVAEMLIAESDGTRLAEGRERDVLIAIELWSMAQEARNQARMAEAVELAGRAKKRLAKASERRQTQEEVARIAELRLALAEQFPENDQEVDARRADLKRESDLASGKANEGEGSK